MSKCTGQGENAVSRKSSDRMSTQSQPHFLYSMFRHGLHGAVGMMFMHMRSMLLYVICLLYVYVCYILLYVVCL